MAHKKLIRYTKKDGSIGYKKNPFYKDPSKTTKTTSKPKSTEAPKKEPTPPKEEPTEPKTSPEPKMEVKTETTAPVPTETPAQSLSMDELMKEMVPPPKTKETKSSEDGEAEDEEPTQISDSETLPPSDRHRRTAKTIHKSLDFTFRTGAGMIAGEKVDKIDESDFDDLIEELADFVKDSNLTGPPPWLTLLIMYAMIYWPMFEQAFAIKKEKKQKALQPQTATVTNTDTGIEEIVEVVSD
jgi:hypothetical protein